MSIKIITFTGDFFVVISLFLAVKDMKSLKKNRQLKCFRCNAFIHVPTDYIGNPYTLLEVHYMVEHSIDLKSIDWQNPKTVLGDDIILSELQKLDDMEKDPESEL